MEVPEPLALPGKSAALAPPEPLSLNAIALSYIDDEVASLSALDYRRFNLYICALTALQTAVFYPLELLKTRLQASSGAAGRGHALALLTEWRAVLAAGGARALFRGLGVAVGGAVACESVYYSTFARTKLGALRAKKEAAKTEGAAAAAQLAEQLAASGAGLQQLLRLPLLPPAAASAGAVVLAAAAAEVACTLVAIPADIVSQRLQVRQITSSGSALKVAREIWFAEGSAGFFRGTCASLATFLPYSVAWWAAYEGGKLCLLRRHRREGGERGSERQQLRASADNATGALSLLLGLGAGAAGTLATNPLDVVRAPTVYIRIPRSVRIP